MVAAMAIDTHGFVKVLTAAGVPTAQAEAHVEALRDKVLPELATRHDLLTLPSELRSEMSVLRSALRSEMNELCVARCRRLGPTCAARWQISVPICGRCR